MRICRIYSALSLKPEGFGVGLYELSLAQQKLENEVFIINRTLNSKKIKNLKYSNLSYNFIPYIPKLDIINYFVPYGILSNFRMNQLIENKMIDIIHIHDNDAIYAIKKNNKIPLVSTLHVDITAQMRRIGSKNTSFRSKMYEIFKFQFNRLIWRKASAIICISRQTKNRLINIYRVPDSKIYYIPNGVNINKFTPKIETLGLKSALNINQNYPIILFIGRIYPLKGLKELIIAISQIKKFYPTLLLLIIGEIQDWSYYKKNQSIIKRESLTKNIKIIGKIPYSLMPQIYRIADVFILPSYSEGMPKVVLEAMASRLCVITTDIEGNKDLIKNNFNGILIKPKNIPEIYQSLLKVSDDKHLREDLAFNAWKTAQMYDWLNIAKKIQKVYEIVLKK